MSREEQERFHKEILEEPDQKESSFGRYFALFGGVVMIFLMLSFTVVTFPVGDIVAGWFESSPLKGNTIDTGSIILVFEGNTKDQLLDIYHAEQEVEFSVCLQGWKEQKTYYITSLYQPTMYFQAFNHVRFESCNEETLVMLHSHPYKRCAASDTDLQTLEKSQEQNPDMLMVVMCEPGRFSVYV